MEDHTINWETIAELCSLIALRVACSSRPIDKVIGLARGGVIPGSLIARKLEVEFIAVAAQSYDENNIRGELKIAGHQVPGDNFLVVDDICDSGHTLKAMVDLYSDKEVQTASLIYKENDLHVPNYYGKLVDDESWIIFPWET